MEVGRVAVPEVSSESSPARSDPVSRSVVGALSFIAAQVAPEGAFVPDGVRDGSAFSAAHFAPDLSLAAPESATGAAASRGVRPAGAEVTPGAGGRRVGDGWGRDPPDEGAAGAGTAA